MERATHGRPTVTVFGIALAATVGSILLGKGATGEPRGLSQAAQDTSQRPECPLTNLEILIPKGKNQPPDTLRVLPESGPITDIPEFHDCQRFVREDGDYDALYAIFASFMLPQLTSIWQDTLEIIPEARPFVAAQIYSWGGSYPSLGIAPGFNCLHLYGTAVAPRAKMVQHGPENPRCREEHTDGTRSSATSIGEKTLYVRRTALGNFAPYDYPPVARWEWDSVGRRQYIGIACGAAWCEVYSWPSLTSAPAYSALGISPTALRRTGEIKAWFDEQQLAVAPPGAPDFQNVVPSRTRGTVFPDPALGGYTMPAFGRWLPVAYVRLTGAGWPPVAPPQLHSDGYYRTAFGFLQVSPGVIGLERRGDTRVDLCRGQCPGLPARFSRPTLSAAACGRWPTNDPLQPQPPQDPRERWWARITNARGDTLYKCVLRRAHEGLQIRIPGIVRWRWMANDETLWVACTQGCCELIQ